MSQPAEKIESTVDELAALWRHAKDAEDACRKKRIDLERLIAERVEVKAEGSKTTKTEHFAITATGRLIRKLDLDKFEKIKDQIPADLRPVRNKLELDLAGVRWLEQNEPEVYRTFAQCLETKPGKTGFKIELIEE